MQVLNFSDFEFVHGVFSLPTDHVVFRSHDPLYFGDLEVAEFYQGVTHNRVIKVCMPNKPLRYVRSILPVLLNPVSKTRDYLNIIEKLSYDKQIQVLESYNKPILRPFIDRMNASHTVTLFWVRHTCPLRP